MSVPIDDPGGPGIVLNVGGQGEVVYAIDINNLISPTIPPARWIRPGRFIQADATALPIRADAALAVVANRFPAGDPAWRDTVAAEALRVLVTGGGFRIWSVTGGGFLWLSHLEAAGFSAVTMERGHATGAKP
jgi:hypothetical protein